jgi:broad specificity phosphatase PhoE
MPYVRPHVDPAAWPLSAAGRMAARQLMAKIPVDSVLVASDEPKAWQTLSPDGDRHVLRDNRLGEVRRAERFTSDFERVRRDYVGGQDLEGWEPRVQVCQRFAAAVTEAMQAASDRDLVVASHGMAMTIWLNQTISLPDPEAFWADLKFPDLLLVDLPAHSAVKLAPG